ncbi:DoxX family protein [Kineosporia sp. J2-2]|uniref:DoxX family protein n=1 Tax=Kineosporia corallincola TaxID=2835133 RepID=A0ABS5TNB6_9ACTN|nr:DoxX family protein [Kineosporia corallincola]MBT0772591.1 DoxX family protein [Kineosporia corallincola]
MDVVLWVVAALLAAAFAAAGAMKLAQPRAKLIESGMGWAGDFGDGQVKLIGLVEVLGAIGLILPAALGIVPVLTPLAAAGLFVTMVVAVVVHLRRGEGGGAVPALVLGLLSLFVAIMRFGPNSF